MIGVVGATGLVGQEIRKLLVASTDGYENSFRCFASQARPEESVLGLESSLTEMRECKFILNAATAEIALRLRETMGPDQVLIDNSAAFRLEPDVPLVVPEVNGMVLEAEHPVIANPNCTAILLCLGLNALRDIGITRVVLSTYQAASGAGIRGLEELESQLKALGQGHAIAKPETFPYQLLLNVLSHNSEVRAEGRLGAGYNDEECKVVEETRKILSISHLPVSATCVRVPVRRAHTEAVTVDLKREMSLEELRQHFAAAPGIKIVDHWDENHFPMPLEAEGVNEVLVGRIRKDIALPRTVHFMLAGDQLLKGAALNAVQIMRAIRGIRDRNQA